MTTDIVPWEVLVGEKDEPSKRVRVGHYCNPVEPHKDGKHVILSITEYRKIEETIKRVKELEERVAKLESNQGPRIL